VNGAHGSYFRAPIVLSYSDDGGSTWSAPKVISGSNPTCTFQSDGSTGTECDEDQNSIPEVAPNGDLLVYFGNYQNEDLWEIPGDFDAQMMVVRSTNGGQSFGAPTVAADREDGASDTPWSVIGRQTMWGHQIRWSADGNITISPTDPDEVVIVYSDRGTPNPNAKPGCADTAPGDPPNYDPCNAGPSSNYDIWKVASHDGGLTWDAPVKVESDPGQSWFPWADFMPNGTTLAVAWDQDDTASPADTFHHVLKVGGAPSQDLMPNTAEGRSGLASTYPRMHGRGSVAPPATPIHQSRTQRARTATSFMATTPAWRSEATARSTLFGLGSTAGRCPHSETSTREVRTTAMRRTQCSRAASRRKFTGQKGGVLGGRPHFFTTASDSLGYLVAETFSSSLGGIHWPTSAA
jgi:hypothetical protein